MKKIVKIFLSAAVFCALSSAVCNLYAGAVDVAPDVAADYSDVVAEHVEQNLIDPDYNPQTPWYRGFQFGAGVPLVLPMTGYNGFVGYANKQADSFWGKRFGVRLDFQVPNALRGEASLSKNDGGEWELGAKAETLFLNHEFNDLYRLEHDMTSFELDGDQIDLDLSGTDIVFFMKNQNLGGIIDFYPFGNTWFLGGIRLSGGYYSGSMDFFVDIKTPDVLPNSNGLDYYLDRVAGDKIHLSPIKMPNIRADLKWKYQGPYAGIGFDLGVLAGFKFYFDAGVVFAHAPAKMSKNDLIMPTISACAALGGKPCGQNINIDLDSDVPPDITNLFADILKQAIEGKVDDALGGLLNDNQDILDMYEGMLDQYKDVIAENTGMDPSQVTPENVPFGEIASMVADDVFNFLTYKKDDGKPGTVQDYLSDPGNSNSWIYQLNDLAGQAVAEAESNGADVSAVEIAQIWDQVAQVKSDYWDDPDSEYSIDKIQRQVNDNWADYRGMLGEIDKKVGEINTDLEKYKFMPMIKLGVMYRF